MFFNSTRSKKFIIIVIWTTTLDVYIGFNIDTYIYIYILKFGKLQYKFQFFISFFHIPQMHLNHILQDLTKSKNIYYNFQKNPL